MYLKKLKKINLKKKFQSYKEIIKFLKLDLLYYLSNLN